MSIRILLADDHQMMRQGLKSLLGEQPDFEVVGEAADGRTAVRLAQELSAAVVIMDVTMPDLNGIDATRQLKAEAPDVKVIGLSMHPERQFVLEMLSVGASGYLLKDCPFTELVQAIRAAVAGDVYLSPKVAGVVVRGRGANSAVRAPTRASGRSCSRSPREEHEASRARPSHQHQDRGDSPPADHGKAEAVQRRRAGPLRDPRGADAAELLTAREPDVKESTKCRRRVVGRPGRAAGVTECGCTRGVSRSDRRRGDAEDRRRPGRRRNTRR